MRGEIALSKTTDVKNAIKQAISRKQSASKTLSVFENIFALALQILWIASLVYLSPFLSGIHGLDA